MKELIYHRQFFPAMERWADKVGFQDGQYKATFAQHGERVMRLALRYPTPSFHRRDSPQTSYSRCG